MLLAYMCIMIFIFIIYPVIPMSDSVLHNFVIVDGAVHSTSDSIGNTDVF